MLRCRGDEDLATKAARRPAFARASKAAGDIVVDLTELAFADSTLVFDLAILAQRLRAAGRQLQLFAPQPQIARLIDLVGLDRQPGVRLAYS